MCLYPHLHPPQTFVLTSVTERLNVNDASTDKAWSDHIVWPPSQSLLPFNINDIFKIININNSQLIRSCHIVLFWIGNLKMFLFNSHNVLSFECVLVFFLVFIQRKLLLIILNTTWKFVHMTLLIFHLLLDIIILRSKNRTCRVCVSVNLVFR